MQTALDGANPKDQTGIVRGLFPPHVIGVRCRTKQRGRYQVFIMNTCPWCRGELPNGTEKDPLLHVPGEASR